MLWESPKWYHSSSERPSRGPRSSLRIQPDMDKLQQTVVLLLREQGAVKPPDQRRLALCQFLNLTTMCLEFFRCFWSLKIWLSRFVTARSCHDWMEWWRMSRPWESGRLQTAGFLGLLGRCALQCKPIMKQCTLTQATCTSISMELYLWSAPLIRTGTSAWRLLTVNPKQQKHVKTKTKKTCKNMQNFAHALQYSV